jgi:hypothetical protein
MLSNRGSRMSQLKEEGDHSSNSKPISHKDVSKFASFGIPEVVDPLDHRAHQQPNLYLTDIDTKSEFLSKLSKDVPQEVCMECDSDYRSGTNVIRIDTSDCESPLIKKTAKVWDYFENFEIEGEGTLREIYLANPGFANHNSLQLV